MLIAKKGNKRYKIQESQKNSYKAQGFDITDEKGKELERGNRPTVKRVKELEAENDKLRKENAKLKKATKEASK